MSSSSEEEFHATLEDGWEWKRRSLIDTIYTISNHDRLSVMTQLNDVLFELDQEVHLKLVKRSCFAKFFRLPPKGERCNKGVHYVMSREIIRSGGSGDETEMWFRIKEKNIRFSRYEFALISGLRFGGSNFDPNVPSRIEADSVFVRFLGSKSINPSRLLKLFIEKEFGREPDDYLKVAKILFVALVLFGIDMRHKIPVWLWALVEDEEEWESFPWGSLAYQRLIYFLKRVPTKEKEQSRPSYHLWACSFIFTAWIYEAIELLGKTCGVVSNKKAIPRMCRYEYKWSNMDHGEISGKVHSTLKPGTREKASVYWTSIETGPFLVQIPRSMFRERQSSKKNNVEHESRDGDESDDNGGRREQQQYDFQPSRGYHFDDHQPFRGEGTSGEQTYGPNDPVMQCTMSQFQSFVNDAVERAANSAFSKTQTWLTGYLPEIISCGSDATQSHSPEQTWGWNPPTPWGWQEGGAGPSTRVEDVQNDNTEIASPGWSMYMKGTDIPEHGTWKSSLLPGDEAGWSTPDPRQPTRDIEPVSYPSYTTPSKLDFREVRRRAAAAALRSPFIPYEKREERWQDWYKDGSNAGLRNVGIGFAVDQLFFASLVASGTDLTDAHIDAYLAILHAQPGFALVRVKHLDVVLTSVQFSNAVRSIFERYHNLETVLTLDANVEQYISNEDLHALSKYVTGEMPDWCPPKPWHNYNKLTLVAHLGCHWVTVRIDFKRCSITLYDSKQHLWSEHILALRKAYFIPLMRVLPQLLKYCGFWDARPDLTPVYTQWKFLTPTENPYKQDDSSSCGLYALRYAELFMSNDVHPMKTIKDLEDYRRKLALTIFHY